jgi:hypothetical protein
MPANELLPRRYARFVRLLAAALVLLGLSSGPGCGGGDKPTAPTAPAKQDPNRRMPT